jgi:hypothetical protein
MRAKVAVFLFGLTVGMWTDAILVELDSTVTVYEWVVGESVDMLQPIEEEEAGEPEHMKDVPDADWLNKATPPFRPA